MKEKDIVNFDELQKENEELIDEYGNEIGCPICHTHEKAYEYFKDDAKKENSASIPNPRCPVCGSMLDRWYNNTYFYGNTVVSEVNYSNPEGNIGLYSIWSCPQCKDIYSNNQLYALMPEPIIYNANHDIFYTGGKDHISSERIYELVKLIESKTMDSINQYVRRKLNPKNYVDETLTEKLLDLWCSRDIEHAVAEWLYTHGYKK